MWPQPAPRRRASWHEPQPRTSGVVACVDGSSYLGGVCDHAAWFADRLSTSIELLCVDEPNWARHRPPFTKLGDQPVCSDRAPVLAQHPALDAAATRLFDDGAEVLEFCTARGRFAPVAASLAAGADVIVIGRRGTSADRSPGPVGAAGPELLRLTKAPICIAPKVFFPIHRALVVGDPMTPDRKFADLIATLPCLDRLDLRLATPEFHREKVVLRIVGSDAERRYQLGDAGRPDPHQPGQCDLVVLPRSTSLEPDGRGALATVARSLLASRLPVLFC